MNKTAIYTVLLNDYDELKPIRNEKGFDYFVFTDDKDLMVAGWQPILIEKGDVKKQREIKILAHKYLPDYKTTVYIDANMMVKRGIARFLQGFKGGILITKHPLRNCVYDEAEACIKLGKAPEKDIKKQIARYRKMKFPDNYGMWSTGFLVRENRKDINEFCEAWNKELQSQTHRDQLSIGYALRKCNIKPQEISYQELNRYIRIYKHKKKSSNEIKIRCIQPWSSKKNIGGANNEEIQKYHDDDWIVLTDGDSCWVLPDWGAKVEEVIRQYGNEFDLIGCTVNRLGGLHQCYNNEFDTKVDGYEQWDRANEVWEKYGAKVETTSGVAGVCLIFKKSTWKRVGGFKENSITADTEFNKSIRRTGGKIGIAKGLYRMHLYRIWEKDHKKAWASSSHLR